MANVTVTTSTSNVNVNSTTNEINVSTTSSNIVVGTIATVSNADVRAAISNIAPILYNSTTGVISIDQNAILSETFIDSGNIAGNISLDLNQGNNFRGVLTADITGITLANVENGDSVTLVVEQNSIGGHNIDTSTHASNWTDFAFVNGFSTLDTNPNNWSILNIIYDGTSGSQQYYGSVVTETSSPIPNSDLANSNVVINGVTIDLGSSGTIAPNTDLTAFSVTSNSPSGNGSLSYSNVSGIFTFTPADTSSGGGGITNAQAQSFIQSSGLAMTANITSNSLISTTGNLQVNADTSINGLKGLTFDNTNNFLGLGTTTPGVMLDGTNEDSALHIQCVDQFHGTLTIEEARGTPSGPEINFVKAGYDTANSALAPVISGNRIGEIHYEGYDGSAYKEGLYHNAFVDGTVSSGTVPMGWEIRSNGLGTSTNRSMFKVRGDGTVELGIMSTDDSSGGTNVTIQTDGNISTSGKIDATGTITGGTLSDGTLSINSGAINSATTGTFSGQVQAGTFTDGSFSVTGGNFTTVGSIGATGNIETNGLIKSYGGNIETTTGNISGSYILGNGSQLTGIVAGGSTDSFGTVTVAGQTNIQASQANAILDIASTGDITLTTSGNTLTIGGSGSAYGNTQVENFLSSGTITGNIETSGFHIGDLDGAVVQDVRNETGATLVKGKAVYLTGSSTGDNPHVALADADDIAKMPALGIVYSNIANASVGQVTTSGVINVASHGFTQGADLFISTTAGDLTETAPTGESAGIQKIGKVVTANHIIVQGAFRQNATPNLDQNKIFIGNAANRATTVALDNLTANIKTTGNLQVNPDTTINGLKGLTFDTTNNFLGLGTTTPGVLLDGSSQDSALHIFCNDQFHGTITVEESRNSTSGPEINFAKAWDTSGTPSAVGNSNRLGELNYFGYDGTDMLERGAFRGFVDYPQQSGFTVNPGNVPVGWEFITSEVGNTSLTNSPSVFKVRANGTIQVGSMDATSSNNGVQFQVTSTGAVTTNGNITGSNYFGNGSNLTGIDLFKTISVSGQTDVVADSISDTLTLAAGSGMTITTDAANDTITFASSGGTSYGNAEVQTYLASGNNAANIETAGNLIIAKHTGTVVSTISSYFGSNNTGSYDQIAPSTDPLWSDATAIVFSGTTNGDLTFLNGNTYYTKSVGGGFYDIFTNSGLTTPVQSGLDGESPDGLVASYPGLVNSRVDVAGDVFTTGSLELSSANVLTTITQYQGNTTTGSGDRITIGSDQGWYNGQYVTFSGATDSDLLFLNGNTYQVATGSGSGTTWNLYTNYQSFTKLSTAIGTFNNPNGPLVADHRTPNDTSATIYGDLIVNANSVLKVNKIESFFPNQVIELTGLRVNDFKGNDPLNPPSYTNTALATLQAPFPGGYIFVTGDRAVDGEGVPAYWSGTQWKYFSDNANVSYT
jgi:fibronectin-binding autotransporter adhesin